MSNIRIGSGSAGSIPKFLHSFDLKTRNVDSFFFDPVHDMNERFTKEELLVTESCPACGNADKLFKDTTRGELACAVCGNIINDHDIDFRGIRVFDHVDIENKVHHEPMSPASRPVIYATRGDATSRRRARENNRIEWKVKKILIMKIELSKIKSRLPFSKEVEDHAMEHIEKVFNSGLLRGRSAIPMAMALLYYACIQCNSPVGFKEIIDVACDAARDDAERDEIKKSIHAAKRALADHLGYKFTTRKEYANFLSTTCNMLNIKQYNCTIATKLMRLVGTEHVFSGNPTGYAGACLFHACRYHDPSLFNDKERKALQKQIASAIRMTEVTLRRRVVEIDGFLEKRGIDLGSI